MNEIEAQVKDVEERATLPIVLKWFMGVMVVCLLANYFDLNDKYYQGEELSTIVITIEGTPEFKDGGKSGTDRFSFKSVEHSSRFWIMSGALTIVLRTAKTKETIVGLKQGQQATLKIHKSDIDVLEQGDARIPVIGLQLGKDVLISPQQVMDEDAKSIRLNMIICSVLFFAVLLGLNWKWIRKAVDYK